MLSLMALISDKAGEVSTIGTGRGQVVVNTLSQRITYAPEKATATRKNTRSMIRAEMIIPRGKG